MSDLDQQLKAAYRKHKASAAASRSKIMTKRLLRHKHPEQHLQRTWWSVSGAATVAVLGLIFVVFNSQLPVLQDNSAGYLVDVEQYQQLEQHQLIDGEYVLTTQLATVQTQYQQQREQLQQSQQDWAQFGQLVSSDKQTWYIADCQHHTLIAIAPPLLAQLTAQQQVPTSIKPAQWLALQRSTNGEITAISMLGSKPASYSCP